MCFFFFKQKTAYEMRISDWSSDVCSSDLSALIQNAAEATLKGVELELTAIPVAGLELSGSLGYTDPKYVRYVDPATGADLSNEIGRASCRERVCQYV